MIILIPDLCTLTYFVEFCSYKIMILSMSTETYSLIQELHIINPVCFRSN